MKVTLMTQNKRVTTVIDNKFIGINFSHKNLCSHDQLSVTNDNQTFCAYIDKFITLFTNLDRTFIFSHN